MAKDQELHRETPEVASSAGQDVAGARTDPLVGQALQRFVQNQRAPRTRVEYEKILRDFLRIAQITTLPDLLACTPDQVIEFRNGLQARGLAPATIMTRLAAISGLFDLLVLEGRLEKNPASSKLVKEC